MRKLVLAVFVILFMTSNLNAQSTERFIRIIGNAKKELKANKTKIYFTISELKESKYQKTGNKSYDDAYSEFVLKLTELGFKEMDIKNSIKKRKTYNKLESKNFFIESDINSSDKLTSLKLDGYRVSDIKYVLPVIDKNTESELSINAMEDAKRKASAICNSVKMKLGKILNIEVKSNGFDKTTTESKEALLIKTYKVTVTYKLID